MTQQEFIKTVGTAAYALYGTYGILPSVTIAQAILESGWGKSELATKANALFGIKASNIWTGNTYAIKTLEYVNGKQTYVTARFRAYPNWSASIIDHSDFLYNISRYKNIIGNTDYKSVCELLYKDGYATDPGYSQKLKTLIESYNLTSYDTMTTTQNGTPHSVVTYTIQPGDTLNDIARVHNTSVAELVKLNNISNPNVIKAGEKLVLN